MKFTESGSMVCTLSLWERVRVRASIPVKVLANDLDDLQVSKIKKALTQRRKDAEKRS